MEGMPANEVAKLAARARDEQRIAAQRHSEARKLAREAKEQAKEAKRFYNSPAAQADFTYWARVESWTLDEAVALLLARDPRVVTPASMDIELTQPTGLLGLEGVPKRAKFHRAFDELRTLMARAEALAAPRLRPRDVLAWTQRTGAAPIPPALDGEVARFEALSVNGEIGGIAASPKAHADMRNGTARKWTPELLAELKRCKEALGTRAAAEQFGISMARVRILAPTKRPKAGDPLAAITHRLR